MCIYETIDVLNCGLMKEWEISSSLAWRNVSRLPRESNPWPSRCRCDALPTELWSHPCWELVNLWVSHIPSYLQRSYLSFDYESVRVIKNVMRIFNISRDSEGCLALENVEIPSWLWQTRRCSPSLTKTAGQQGEYINQFNPLARFCSKDISVNADLSVKN